VRLSHLFMTQHTSSFRYISKGPLLLLYTLMACLNSLMLS